MFVDRNFLFHAERANFGRHVSLYLSRELENGSCEVVDAQKPRLIEDPHSKTVEPMLQIRSEQAQQLMDSLWAAGFRPVDGHGSAGQIGAIERHLNDMRALVQKVLDAPLPGAR